MKEVIYNTDNIKDEDMDELIIRTKGLIINSKNEISLGYSHGTYQFPGGHLEENETLEEGLVREIKEETGIELKDYSMKPFFKTVYYTKNYHNSGKNRKNEIYFYIIKTDEVVNMSNSNFTDSEKSGNYEVKVISLDDVENVLNSTINDNPINEVIYKEMLDALNEYRNL